MTRLSRKLEGLLSDITFAEDCDFSSSLETTPRTLSQELEDTFTAVAFAEAGEFDVAASYLNRDGELPKSPRAGRTAGRFGRPCAGRA